MGSTGMSIPTPPSTSTEGGKGMLQIRDWGRVRRSPPSISCNSLSRFATGFLIIQMRLG